jgi:hypothetical protein
MFDQLPKTNWIPYKIPSTPSYDGGPNTDPYTLSPKAGSNPEKNPSSQIEWKQIPVQEILNRLTEIESRLNSASISANCSSGNIVVTLNL